MAKKNKNKDGVMYSTDPDFSVEDDSQQDETLAPEWQTLKIFYEVKGRRGKPVSIIRGFVGSDLALSELAKSLKTLCGAGGTAKDGEVLIQGDFRDKIRDYLKTQGYKTKG